MATSDKSISWATVNPQIYALAFTNQGLPSAWYPICTIDNGHHTYDCPNFGAQARPSPPKPSPSLTTSTQPLKRPRMAVDHCILYNQFDGHCCFGKQCKYIHECASCGVYGHPMRRCPSRRQPGATNQHPLLPLH